MGSTKSAPDKKDAAVEPAPADAAEQAPDLPIAPELEADRPGFVDGAPLAKLVTDAEEDALFSRFVLDFQSNEGANYVSFLGRRDPGAHEFVRSALEGPPGAPPVPLGRHPGWAHVALKASLLRASVPPDLHPTTFYPNYAYAA